jgi:hypothetical protein
MAIAGRHRVADERPANAAEKGADPTVAAAGDGRARHRAADPANDGSAGGVMGTEGYWAEGNHSSLFDLSNAAFGVRWIIAGTGFVGAGGKARDG